LLPEGKKNATKEGSLSPSLPSSRQAAFLFLRRSEDLETEEQETLIALRHLHPEIDLAYDLVQQFAHPARALAQANCSTPGLSTSETARSASSKALWEVLNETKQRSSQA